MNAKNNKEQMIALRKAGKTYEEIAEQYGVSKQWVYQIIRDVCRYDDRARKHSLDIENIVYEGIYQLFANDYKMTELKFARITFGIKTVKGKHRELIRRLLFNRAEVRLSLRNIRNICEYIGEPFEYVFRVRKGADDEQREAD